MLLKFGKNNQPQIDEVKITMEQKQKGFLSIGEFLTSENSF
jgi:hypothetical protein